MNSILSLTTGFFLLLSTSVLAAKETKIDLTTGTPKNKEEMVFSKDKLKAKAGEKITLTFKNGSSSKGMMHNFVLTEIGKAQVVLDASIKAGPDQGWVASVPEVLAKSKLLDAGESAVIEFTAPAKAGEYPFICTFPGHASMKGVLKVTL